MKKIILLLTLFVSSILFSQIYNPVKWSTLVEKVSDTEYVLVTTAVIEKGNPGDGEWGIYGQGKRADKGPVPTSFTFEPNDNYELVGKNEGLNGHVKFDETFQMEIKKFHHKAEFKQKIKLKAESAVINVEVLFMVCNNVRCLPPEPIQLVFYAPQTSKAKNENNPELQNTKFVKDEEANELLYGVGSDEIEEYQGEKQAITESTNTNNDTTDIEATKKVESRSLLALFGLAMLGGFAALLTPCVFPMIPMTVSYFTKQSKNKAAGIKNAIFYGICIILIYVFLGIVVTQLFGPEILNAMSSNPIFNLVFFILLGVFAFSFFGFFEISLPSSWSTNVDNQADRGGYIGIFFMALALAIVSFSCTGPIVGALLVGSVTEGASVIAPVIGMLGFSLAIALPFALFAAFPGWLNSLPTSGGWMTSVKVVLGFLELALAFKFLSIADLKWELGILKYEVFVGIWIVLFLALALYLFGKIKFPHDGPIKKLSIPRIILGLTSLAFSIYLCFGFQYNPVTGTYKPLALLSGLAPPAGYSIIYGHDKDDSKKVEGNAVGNEANHCPNNLPCFKDFKKGLAYAKKNKKPIMIDFTGISCVNCRRMEDNVWSVKKIDSVIRNNYVLISLYVDDNEHKLPENEQITVKGVSGKKKTLKSYGSKWSHLQAKFFKTNSQPQYILMGYEEEELFDDTMYNLKEINTRVGYTPNTEEYFDWLVKGTEEFKKLEAEEDSEDNTSTETNEENKVKLDNTQE